MSELHLRRIIFSVIDSIDFPYEIRKTKHELLWNENYDRTFDLIYVEIWMDHISDTKRFYAETTAVLAIIEESRDFIFNEVFDQQLLDVIWMKLFSPVASVITLQIRHNINDLLLELIDV